MPWQDPFETFIGASGELYTADVGTAFPAGFTAPSAADWDGLGFASEDGVAVRSSRTIAELRAWQRQNPIRRSKTEETFGIGAALLQWNEVTVPAALGGGTITAISGGYQYSPPGAEDTLEEKAMIVDLFDGDRQMRILIARGTSGADIESTFQRGAFAELPLAFDALQPDTGDLFNILFSDDDAFAAGS